MQFLRILLLPLLSILLVSENHALEHIYSPPLGVRSGVKNNAHAPVKVYKNGIYSHTTGKDLPGTPISMENIDTPTGGHWRRWGAKENPTENHSGKTNCFFEAAFSQLDNSIKWLNPDHRWLNAINKWLWRGELI